MAEYLPFKADSFDTIVSLTALHHTHITKVIQELKRLKPKQMAFSILKKSKQCESIVNHMQKAFPNVEIIEEEKDIILIIK